MGPKFPSTPSSMVSDLMAAYSAFKYSRPVEAISFSSLRMAETAMCQILGGGIFRDAIT